MRLSTSKLREKIFKLTSSRYFFQIFALLFLLMVSQATEAFKVKSTQANISNKLEEFVVVEDKKEEEFKQVEEIVGKVVAQVAPSPKAEVKAVSDTVKTEGVSDKKNSQICKGETENWKMVPDPDHAGQYIICNTQSGKMTTVDELNAAQNSYRQKHGLSVLNINSELCKIAANRAVEVSKNFSHSGFESAVKGSGLGKNSYGENIASGPLSGVQFVEWSWDKSPGHRENMLSDWTEGCGGVFDKYAVFLFAK